MTDHWRRVVTLYFDGDRYEERALDVAAWGELQRFQTLVTETAIALWRNNHPNRQRLPRRFEDRTRLWLRKIEDGSTSIPFEIPIDKPLANEFLAPQVFNEVTEAIDIVYRVFISSNNDVELPVECPKQLIADYARLGEGLNESNTLQFSPPEREFACVTEHDRKRLEAIAESSYEDEVDITGRVLEADVKQRRCQIWIDDKRNVAATFTLEQETLVTSALKEHESMRVRVRGRGQFTPEGRPSKITQVTALEPVEGKRFELDDEAPSIEEVMADIFGDIPDRDWDCVPTDLSRRLDSYIYGPDKR